MGFYVRFYGTRGSIPTPGWQTRKFGGNTPCVTVRYVGAETSDLFICDGGTGLRKFGIDLGRQLGRDKPLLAHLLFSHGHWDHIQGFPFFGPAYVPNNRLVIHDTAADLRFYNLLSGQMQADYFPVALQDLGADIASAVLSPEGQDIAGVRVSFMRLHHPGGSLAYKFEAGGLCVVYATDNELDLDLENIGESLTHLDAVRHGPAQYLDFVRGADLLIADGQYTDVEYPGRVNWGHSRATTAVDVAIAAGVKRLAIFHHDPMHSDAVVSDILNVCAERAKRQGSSLVVFAAREDVELHVH
jgi:phosphoribosyl 1,2-cyclic phosphodiesterase